MSDCCGSNQSDKAESSSCCGDGKAKTVRCRQEQVDTVIAKAKETLTQA